MNEGEGLITDSGVAKAEAQFVRDEANYFKYIYSDRIQTDAQALQVGSDFVDRLRRSHPAVYQLGVTTGDLYNEVRHAIPDDRQFDSIWTELYRTHMAIDTGELKK